MRVLALVLLLLINSFSLPLQAMNSHVMSENIPCNMPGMMAEMAQDQQSSSDVHTTSSCQPNDMTTSSDLTDMAQSDCDMSGNCSTASALPFININKLVIASCGRTEPLLYCSTYLPEQHPESLYRPPLIV